MMEAALVTILRGVYRATPSAAIRRLYYAAFCRLVRGRERRMAIDGLTYALDLGEMIDLSILLRCYEPEVVQAIRRFCRPGMVVMDIGANIGAHTLLLGQLTGPKGRVYAFEPTDYAYQKLERNLSLNALSWVSAVKVALSDQNAEEQAIACRASWTTDGSRKDAQSTTDLVRLDDWCGQHGVGRVDLVKMDVDGNEYPILIGGMKVFVASRPIMLLEAVRLHFDNDARNPFALLETLGYHFAHAKSGAEFSGVDEIRRLLPMRDPAMTTSINILARVGR